MGFDDLCFEEERSPDPCRCASRSMKKILSFREGGLAVHRRLGVPASKVGGELVVSGSKRNSESVKKILAFHDEGLVSDGLGGT